MVSAEYPEGVTTMIAGREWTSACGSSTLLQEHPELLITEIDVEEDRDREDYISVMKEQKAKEEEMNASSVEKTSNFSISSTQKAKGDDSDNLMDVTNESDLKTENQFEKSNENILIGSGVESLIISSTSTSTSSNAKDTSSTLILKVERSMEISDSHSLIVKGQSNLKTEIDSNLENIGEDKKTSDLQEEKEDDDEDEDDDDDGEEEILEEGSGITITGAGAGTVAVNDYDDELMRKAFEEASDKDSDEEEEEEEEDGELILEGGGGEGEGDKGGNIMNYSGKEQVVTAGIEAEDGEEEEEDEQAEEENEEKDIEDAIDESAAVRESRDDGNAEAKEASDDDDDDDDDDDWMKDV